MSNKIEEKDTDQIILDFSTLNSAKLGYEHFPGVKAISELTLFRCLGYKYIPNNLILKIKTVFLRVIWTTGIRHTKFSFERCVMFYEIKIKLLYETKNNDDDTTNQIE